MNKRNVRWSLWRNAGVVSGRMLRNLPCGDIRPRRGKNARGVLEYYVRKETVEMKDGIESCTKALIEAIQNSDEYKEFEKNKIRIREYPELRGQIDEFRKRAYLLQNSESSIDLLDEMGCLLKERQELYKNTLISDYLISELNICRILQRVSMEIMSVTDVEITDFEDVISL